MYNLKLVAADGAETVLPCDFITITYYLPGMAVVRDYVEEHDAAEEDVVGIEFELVERLNQAELLAAGERATRAEDDLNEALTSLMRSEKYRGRWSAQSAGLDREARLDLALDLLDDADAESVVAPVQAYLAAAKEELRGAVRKTNARLPDDGVIAYLMNEGGDTMETYKWPPPRSVRERMARLERIAAQAVGA